MKQIKSLSLQSFENRAVKYCRIKKQRQKTKKKNKDIKQRQKIRITKEQKKRREKKKMYIPGLVGSKSIYPSIGNGSSKNKLPKYGTI